MSFQSHPLSTRLIIGLSFVAGLAFASNLPTRSSKASETASDTAAETAIDVAGLRDTLTKGLQARRPSEFRFIDKVVVYVKMGKLTRKMVLETYHWARKKVGIIRTRYPYPYFEAALKRRAAAIGVIL